MHQVELPEEFLKRMERELKEEFPDFLKSYHRERTYGLRVNSLKLDRQVLCAVVGFHLSSVEWCDTGFYYESEEHPGKHPLHEAGLYYIQEPSAMAVVEMLMPKPGERVLDLCAAPGGKTSHIGAKLDNTGFLLSNEIHPQRAKILSQNVERMGLRNTVVTNETPERLSSYFPEFFDRIVVDAPCSGEGMFRKDENARAEWSVENVAMCAARQKMILESAHQMLCPGGCLVYSTCTFSPEEDEEVVEAFLEKHKEYLPLERAVPESFTACRIPGAYRLYPHRLEGEGHFLAVLKKGEGQTEHRPLPSVKALKDKKILADYETFRKEIGLVSFGENYILFGDQLYLMPEAMTTVKGLKIERPGLHLGTIKKNRFEPSHALAMTLQENEVTNTIHFSSDSEQIKAYLRGESISLQNCDNPPRNGWCLVLVDGYSIGWGKVNNGALKNHYPKGLRGI